MAANLNWPDLWDIEERAACPGTSQLPCSRKKRRKTATTTNRSAENVYTLQLW